MTFGLQKLVYDIRYIRQETTEQHECWKPPPNQRMMTGHPERFANNKKFVTLLHSKQLERSSNATNSSSSSIHHHYYSERLDLELLLSRVLSFGTHSHWTLDNLVTIYCNSKRNWKHFCSSSSERFCGSNLMKGLTSALYYYYYYYCLNVHFLSKHACFPTATMYTVNLYTRNLQ